MRTLPRDSAIALIARYPFDFPTGEAMIYNNSAFLLLGHVIEKASGMSYEDYVEKKSELAGAILPWTRPEVKAFKGDASPLIGKYSGPSRGRVMDAEIATTAEGISLSANGTPARPLQWVDGWTFRTGNTYITFRRSGDSGPAAELRFDGGGGFYILNRKP